jgi:putative FmdB family regulatory protein
MPTYQYRCAKCGEQFELWQSIHGDALKRHPGCGGKVTKVLSPAGIVLKGPGFYRTDSRASAGKSRDKSEKADKSDKSESTSSTNGSSSGESSKDGSKSTSSKTSEKSSAKPSKKDT